jgi:beta-glucosidase
MNRTPLKSLLILFHLIACAGNDDAMRPADIRYGAMGPIVDDAGKTGFRFGAASAATQIEDRNENTDWYVWTAPKAKGGLQKGVFVGDAAKGYKSAIADIELLKSMHLDSYRFSIEWARIEPRRNVIDMDAVKHYSDFIDALRAAGIRPIVTVHHFSNPVWIDDPRDIECKNGPTDANLCGLGHPVGGPLVIAEMAEHARFLAATYGDRVDEWATLNEPVNYLLASHGIGSFPPGKNTIFDIKGQFIPVVRDFVQAHAKMYAAIKAADTIDADHDGVAAAVGLTLSVAEWTPAADNQPSSDPLDIAARDTTVYVYHHLLVDSLRSGTFDADLDKTPDEKHPDWMGTLDFLGVQYYFRTGVSGHRAVITELGITPCFSGFDFGSCIPPTDPTFCVPTMAYEYYPQGLYNVLADFGRRYPGLPLVVTESGIATEVGARRAENVVRALEQIERARAEGVDVRGYYHWSVYDNFEWAEGFVPRFGLYSVDYETYARTATEGAAVLGAIAESRTLTSAQRQRYGGVGPMTPEVGMPAKFTYCFETATGP